MTTDRNDSVQPMGPPPPAGPHRMAHGRHGWMMIACCVPMLVIAVALVAAGVLTASFLFVAVGCTAMMALMMRGMNHGGGDQADHSGHAGHGRPDQ
jgi:hypothetical protein